METANMILYIKILIINNKNNVYIYKLFKYMYN